MRCSMALFARHAGSAGLLLALGCAAPGPPPPAVAAQPPPTAAPAPSAKTPRQPVLSAEEREVRAELEAHVGHLSVELGERSVDRHWELADAADYVAVHWEKLGYDVERQGYDVGEVVAQNLEVSVSGGELGRESIIIGAHYDSSSASRGVDSATGVAVLLVLSRTLRESEPARRLRFVAYALGEAPHTGQDSMGSLRHARQVAARGDRVSAMISLDSLGHFRHEPGSQRGHTELDVPLPGVGNFLLLLGAENAEPISRQLVESCPLDSGIHVIARTRRGQAAPPLLSDDWPYERAGVPALVVSDTKTLRSKADADPLEHVDFDRMTRFVTCFSRGIRHLADASERDASADPGR